MIINLRIQIMLQNILKVGTTLSKSAQRNILGGKPPGCDQNGSSCCVWSNGNYVCETATCRAGSCQ